MAEDQSYNPRFKKLPVLSREAERELVIKAKAGDIKARDLLLNHNFGLIFNIVGRYRNKGLGDEDLFQEGVSGFLWALHKFEVERGFKLSTYATWWITQRMSRAIQNTGRLIRIPIHIQELITKVKRIYRKYVEDEQEVPTPEEIAGLAGISVEEAESVYQYIQDIKSLHETTGEDENLTLLDYLADTGPAVEFNVEQELDKQYLFDLLHVLNEDERQVIVLKYGLLDNVERTATDVSELLQLPQAEIQRLEIVAIQKLKSLANKDKINMDIPEHKYNVILISLGEDKIAVYEALHNRLKITLKQIGYMLKNLPSPIQRGLKEEEADELVLALRMAGAEVVLVRSA